MRVLLEQRVVDRQDRAAGIAEDDLDALIHQRLDDDFRPRQFLCSTMVRSFAAAINCEKSSTSRGSAGN